MKKYFQAHWQWKYLAAAALAAIFCLAINFIICIFLVYGNWKIPGYRFEEGFLALKGQSLLWSTIIAIAYVIIAPLAEEIVFRGIALQYFTAKFGFKISAVLTIVTSVLIFLPFHSPIPALILSTIATVITIKNNSVWPAIIFHIANNALIFLLMLALER